MQKTKIAENLRKARGDEPIKEVAKACNTSVSAIYMYENGERVPKDCTKIALAKHYHKTVQELFF
jgi:transcriptional regulator with XRE-family HTH domain